MGFWLDSIGTLGTIPFTDIKIFSFLTASRVNSCNLPYYHVYSVAENYYFLFYYFSVNIRFVLFMVYGFHALTFLQSDLDFSNGDQNYFKIFLNYSRFIISKS